MKKIISYLSALALALAPVAGFAHSREHRGHDYGKHNDTGAVIVGSILGAIIVGSIIRGNDRDREYRDRDYDNRYYDDRGRPTNCWKEPMRDYYGRLYYRTVCEGPEF
jgi:hypothetical protein